MKILYSIPIFLFLFLFYIYLSTSAQINQVNDSITEIQDSIKTLDDTIGIKERKLERKPYETIISSIENDTFSLMDINNKHDSSKNESIDDEVTRFLNEYFYSLPEYYNHENDKVLDYLLHDSGAYTTIVDNKETDIFSDHITFSTNIEKIERQDNKHVDVYATRNYSHKNSDGHSETYVKYQIIIEDESMFIVNFIELDNY